MPNEMTIKANLVEQVAPQSIEESLLDNRSLLEKRLKTQLALPSDESNNQLIRSIITELLEDFAQNEAGLSDNTLKSLFIYWNVFEQWCVKHGQTPLPASSHTFVAYMNDKKSLAKMNTLSHYRWAVSKVHLAAGLPSPTHTKKAIDILSGIRKTKVRSNELITQASPFREVHCDEISNIWSNENCPLECRNKAILVVAYESLLRESELARIELSHIEYHNDGRATLLIPYSKTNLSGEADVVMLSRYCVDTIKVYLGHHVNDSPYLFKKMRRNGKPTSQNESISRYTIDRVFKRAYDSFLLSKPILVQGLNPWSGHSARVGAAQDLLSAGYSVLEVQQAGRWASSEMVYRYGRNILAKESAMAKARWNR